MVGKFKISLFIILALMINACSMVEKERKVDILNKSSKAIIGNTYYLNYPKNGVQQDFLTKKLVVNEDSGKEVVTLFKDKFFKTFGNLTVSETNTDLEKGLKDAKLKGINYFIDVEINEWKDASYFTCQIDKNTGAVMSKDAADITISVYDVASKTMINKQRLIGNGCPTIWLGWISVGTSDPEGYLTDLLDDWIKSL
jgi:hypothetical protein